jgi:hypothetical protein
MNRGASDTLKWIHSNLIEAIYQMPFHQSILSKLKQESIDTLPNLLFYGSVGFPLEYMAYALVSDSTTTPPPKKECMWDTTVPYGEGENFFEIQCRHPDLPKDYGVLCQFLKAIIQSRTVLASKHIFILRDLDIIAQSKYHYALRVLLERFSSNVLFIATTHSLSKLEPPIRSRFMMVRVPQPTPDDCRRIYTRFGLSPASPSPPKTLIEVFINAGAATASASAAPAAMATDFITEFLSKPHAATALSDVRAFAYRCFHKGVPFPAFCRQLIAHKPNPRLAQELSRLEYLLTQSSKGREPLYFEKALYITLFSNSIWR